MKSDGLTLVGRGGGTNKKVGGLTLRLNDCTEAGVQGLHSEEFFSPLASEKVVGLSPPPHSSEWGGGGAKAPSAPPAPPPLLVGPQVLEPSVSKWQIVGLY